MSGNSGVGAAGYFRIARSGKVSMVNCGSLDYGIFVIDEKHRTVEYVIYAFQRSQHLELSCFAYFKFRKVAYSTFTVDMAGRLVGDETERYNASNLEGLGDPVKLIFSPSEIERFKNYLPTKPPALFGMHPDYMSKPGDEVEDNFADFEFGPAQPRLSIDASHLRPGKLNFVIDKDGWLIVGPYHHYILSGGSSVGAAGQIYLDDEMKAHQIHLNFSGHYRPRLTGVYASYTYTTIYQHPLIKLNPACSISGRASFDLADSATKVHFNSADLLSHSLVLDEQIEECIIASTIDHDDSNNNESWDEIISFPE